jgi:hypothetical protein
VDEIRDDECAAEEEDGGEPGVTEVEGLGHRFLSAKGALTPGGRHFVRCWTLRV